ncbi:MAG: hypothetical protein WBF20_01220 [Trebonia sp.]|jgi:hypothetical protein|uniref:hypothetical protein n=1 Tax=Trebonia sp. TaxID=2767075 RepID=UPI003BAF9BFD
MARLAIDKDFLDDYSKLPKPVQNSVKTAIDKFAEHVHAGLHLEKINFASSVPMPQSGRPPHSAVRQSGRPCRV